MDDINEILNRIRDGDESALAELFDLVYYEIHNIARRQAAMDRYTNALTTMELLGEWFIRQNIQDMPADADRRYFFAAVAQTMRRIRVDHYRHRNAQRRGGNHQRVDLEANLASNNVDLNLLALDEALNRLAATHPQHAQIVELHFFAGLSWASVAETLDISLATVERRWKYARAWLLKEMQERDS